MYNYVFRSCSDANQATKIKIALNWRRIPYIVKKVIATDSNGNAQRVYNIYIDKKDLFAANEALNAEKEYIRKKAEDEKSLNTKYARLLEEDDNSHKNATHYHNHESFLKHIVTHWVNHLLFYALIFLIGVFLSWLLGLFIR